MSTSQKKIVVGIMGPGKTASQSEMLSAFQLGALISKQKNWILLTGGSNTGVMHRALEGAKLENPDCTTMGILSCRFDETDKISEYADIKVPTGMGEGRNYLNVLTSDFIVFCCDKIKDSFGTFSELIFAIKHNKPIIFLITPESALTQIQYYINILIEFGNRRSTYSDIITDSPERVIKLIQEWNQNNQLVVTN